MRERRELREMVKVMEVIEMIEVMLTMEVCLCYCLYSVLTSHQISPTASPA